MNEYTTDFFQAIGGGSLKSAQTVVPELVDLFHPQSVIDVGCGTGAWLSVFQKQGVEIFGIDGNYVSPSVLQISSESFEAFDLTLPLSLKRTFDLVVSLEVAEHLPEHCADQFVENLVSLGPIVVFSAAIPFQGGTHHVNEQWPDYWSKKFKSRGYVCADCIRPRIWSNPGVEWWYAQNLLVYLREDRTSPTDLYHLQPYLTEVPLSMVHPSNYWLKSNPVYSGRQLLMMLFRRLWGRVSQRSNYGR